MLAGCLTRRLARISLKERRPEAVAKLPIRTNQTEQHSRWVYTKIWYDPLKLVEAWELLDSCNKKLRTLDTYQYDSVDVARQVLANLATPLQSAVTAAFIDKDRKALQKASQAFLDLMRDIDALLATRPEFLLGSWLENSRKWGATPVEKNHMEWNARNILTHWEKGQASLNDYAHRQWSGLIHGYYLPRWKLFFDSLDLSIASNTSFNLGDVHRAIVQQEESWIAGHERYPSKPNGDPSATAHRLLKKYIPILKKTYGLQKNLATGKPVSASGGTRAEMAVDGIVARDRHWDAKRYYQYSVDASTDGTNWTRWSMAPKTLKTLHLPRH